MAKTFSNTALRRSVKSVIDNAEGLPERVEVYLFGSACHHEGPNDIDMLFVYDSAVVPCDAAYRAFTPLMHEVEHMLRIPVHAVVLSVEEARDSRFIEQVSPIELRSTVGSDVSGHSGI